MATTIKERTFSAVVEKAIQLSNSQFGRPVTLPVAWSKVRVGLRIHFTNNGGGAIIGTPRLAVGLGSGTANMVGDATTTNFIGAYTDDSNNWDTNAGPSYVCSSVVCMKKVGATITTGSALHSFVPGAGADTGTAKRVMFFLDITKGSPNYTLQLYTSVGAPPGDVSNGSFLSNMLVAVPSYSSHSQGTAQTLAFDEVAGALDTVQVYWNRSDALAEVCDVAVALLA